MFIGSALAPQKWPFQPSDLPQSAYLVGGCVRDALLNRETAYLDLDFVLPKAAVETAQKIAQNCDAGFVLLDAERDIARVVFPEATVDFALQVGNSLEEDLHRRDFTINAIAYHPFSDTVIDPLQGQQDLNTGILRMIAAKNLAEDPLRLLRAYRQAAQLGFSLDASTQATIRRLTPKLAGVAAERIKVELSYILKDPVATPWMLQLWQDGLLNTSFPDATASSLALLSAIDLAAPLLHQQFPGLATALPQALNERAKGKEAAQRTLLSTTKWIGLVSNQPSQAETTLKRMKFSRGEINVVNRLLKCWPRLLKLTQENNCARPDQYYLYQDAGLIFPAVVLVAIAAGLVNLKECDKLDLKGLHPLCEPLAPWVAEYLNPHSQLAHPQSLISGQKLMKELDLSPGPKIGHLLSQLALAQAEGKITTTDEALRLAKTILV